MSLPVDKLFCDYVVNKIIEHLEVKKTKFDLIDELLTPTIKGKTLECSFSFDYSSCPCGNEILCDEDIRYERNWDYCDRHDDYLCSNCKVVRCDKCWAKTCCYCRNYDCKVMEHFKNTHPDICAQCAEVYPLEDTHIYNPKETKCKDCYEYFDSYYCKVEGCDWTSQS